MSWNQNFAINQLIITGLTYYRRSPRNPSANDFKC